MKEIDQPQEQPEDKSLLAQTEGILKRYSSEISTVGSICNSSPTYAEGMRPNESHTFFIAPTNPSHTFKDLAAFTENVTGIFTTADLPEKGDITSIPPRTTNSTRKIVVGNITLRELIEEKETIVHGDFEGVTKEEKTFVHDRGVREGTALPMIPEEQILEKDTALSSRGISIYVYPDEKAAQIAHNDVKKENEKDKGRKKLDKNIKQLLKDNDLPVDRIVFGENVSNVVKVPKKFTESE